MNKSNSSEKPAWYKDLSVVRWIFAIFGLLIMFFSGGCSLLLLAELAGSRSGGYINIEAILFIGGIPFLVGALIWWLAAKAGRDLTNQ